MMESVTKSFKCGSDNLNLPPNLRSSIGPSLSSKNYGPVPIFSSDSSKSWQAPLISSSE